MLSIVLVVVAQSMGDVLAATNAINSGIGGPLLGLFSVAMFVPFVNTKGKFRIVDVTVTILSVLESFSSRIPILEGGKCL